MKSFTLKKLTLAALFVAALLIIEITTFVSLNIGVLPKFWWMDVGFYLMLAIVLFLLPFSMQNVISVLVIILNIVLNYAVVCVFASSGRVFDWSMVTLLNETKAAMSMATFPVIPLIIMLGTLIGYFAVWMICWKGEMPKYTKFIKRATVIISLVVLGFITTIVSITPAIIIKRADKKSYFTSDGYMFATFNSARSSLSKFGNFGYYGIDFLRMMFPSLKPEINLDASRLNYDYYTSVLSGVCEKDNVLLIIGESMEDYVISKELTPVLFSLKNGIDLSEVGISKFYDVTMLASGEKELTRKDYLYSSGAYTYNGVNIYDGLTEGEVGLDLVNYNSFESTNFSEYRILTGNSVTKKYSLPWVFNANDYTTSYIHCNYSSFYGREYQMNSEFNFKQTLFYEDMPQTIPNTGDLNILTLDSMAINHYIANPGEFNIFPDGKFFSCFLTVTTHGGHDGIVCPDLLKNYYEFFDSVINRDLADENINIYKSLEDDKLKSSARTFMSKTLDTEKSLALMVDELFKTNRLNDTIICFVSDHFAYAADIKGYKHYYNEKTTNEKSHEIDLYDAPCFIYSPKIKNSELKSMGYNREIRHLTSAYDLAPTLLTLVGLGYDQVVYLGVSVINKSLNSGKWIKPEICYSDTNKFYMNDNTLSYDGYSYMGKVDITEAEKERFREVINILEFQRYYIYKNL